MERSPSPANRRFEPGAPVCNWLHPFRLPLHHHPLDMTIRSLFSRPGPNPRRSFVWMLTCLLAAAPLSPSLQAQISNVTDVRATQPGSIEGTVSLNGRPLANARVGMAGTERVVTTDRFGRFRLEDVSPGIHTLTVTGDGIQRMRVTDVMTRPGMRLTLSRLATMPAGDGVMELQEYVVSAKKLDDVTELDPYEVTDRRPEQLAGGNLDLPRTENDPVPYQVLTREDIQRSGVTDLETFFQRELLQNSQLVTAEQFAPEPSTSANATFYQVSQGLNLRGLGADETVILVNGRRLPSNQLGGNSSALLGGDGRGAADVKTIPLAMIDRIEVLPASGSAMYGASATGGVINIILRRNVQATEVSLTYDGDFDTDAPREKVSLMHGLTALEGRLQLSFTADWRRQKPVTEGDLGLATKAREFFVVRDPTKLGTDVRGATPNIRSTNTTPLFGTATVTSVAPGADGTGGLAAFQSRAGIRNFALFPGVASTNEATQYPYGRSVRQQTYRATALYTPVKWFEVSFDAGWSRTDNDYDFGASSGFRTVTMGTASPLNPFGRNASITFFDPHEILDRSFTRMKSEATDYSVGALIHLPAGWRLTADGNFSETNSVSRRSGVDTTRLTALINAGTYNPLRDTVMFPAPRSVYDQYVYTMEPDYHYNQQEAVVRVTHSDLHLPTGSARVTAGASHRRSDSESYTYREVLGNGTVRSTIAGAGTTNTYDAAFAESGLSLLPERWRTRWLAGIEASVAGRYESADRIKEDAQTYTAAMKFVLAAGVSLRGSHGTGFKPPGTFQLETPPSSGFGLPIIDRRRGNTLVIPPTTLVGNPNLLPEESETDTAGLLFERGKVHTLRLALDWTRIAKVNEHYNAISQNLVDLETYFPQYVTRGPVPANDPYGVGPITGVAQTWVNIAGTETTNWDGSLRYSWTQAWGGTLSAYVRATTTTSFKVQVLPTTPVVEGQDNPNSTILAPLKYRASFGSGWTRRSLGLGWEGRYFHTALLKPEFYALQQADRVKKYWEFDIYGQADLTRWLPWKDKLRQLRAQLRINNLLEADPPLDVSRASLLVRPYGDWRGRTYVASLTTSF